MDSILNLLTDKQLKQQRAAFVAVKRQLPKGTTFEMFLVNTYKLNPGNN